MSLIDRLMKTIKTKKLYFVLGVFILLGLWINVYYKYNHFRLLLMLTLFIFFTCLIAFKKFEEIIKLILLDTEADRLIKTEIRELIHWQKSKVSMFIAVIFAIESNIEFFYLKLLPFNPMGVYIASWLLLILFIAGMGYISFLLYIRMLFRVTKLKLTKYNYYEPANTTYLISIYNLYNTFSLRFLVVGLIFTVIYTIVAPPNMIKIPPFDSFYINYLYEYIFIWSWSVIIFGIIVGYIFLTLYPHILIKRIILNMKNSSKEMLSLYVKKQLPMNLSANDRILVIESYLNIANYIDSTKPIVDYEKSSFVVSFAIMFFSLCIPLASILDLIINVQEVFFNIVV